MIGSNLMRFLTILAPASVFLFPDPAYAYIDPGTGSLILQTLIGAIAGGLIVLKLYWNRLKGFFSGSRQKAESRQEDQ